MNAPGQMGLGELFFHTADLYPNLGFMSTRTATLPEVEDQHALVDDEDMAKEVDVKQNPITYKQILLGFGIIFLFVFLFSARV
ncbi:hypothetical protein B4092_4704 [Bacillus licheniformis]|uniref:hypothetical protein n=1 Tax=Bacillus licheniformis TaxID=1402 RepID=UPI00077952F1|nr:hypothetical protein [Bacillus licheniformis]KYC77729.1 hypothetical protein B4092_4704 [Bacillus licheniformis]TWL81265.1 hypothetical protein CHCC15292_4603 [Bacillus licheniformis]